MLCVAEIKKSSWNTVRLPDGDGWYTRKLYLSYIYCEWELKGGWYLTRSNQLKGPLSSFFWEEPFALVLSSAISTQRSVITRYSLFSISLRGRYTMKQSACRYKSSDHNRGVLLRFINMAITHKKLQLYE